MKNKILSLTMILVASGLLFNGSYIHAKAQLAQYLILSAWDESTTENNTVKPWSWADTWPVARLTMATHKIDQIVLAGTTGESLAFGPGYMFLSAAPTEKGNTILAAHRDTHFSFLEKVKVGEKISVTSIKNKTREYEIQDMRIVDKADVEWVNTGNNPYQLTLVTCYPFNALVPGGRLRYVVRAGVSS